MFNRSLDALYLFSRNTSQNVRKSGSTSKYETDCFHNFHELPQTLDNKLLRYIVNETDNKQTQIHGAKKDKKVRTLKINGLVANMKPNKIRELIQISKRQLPMVKIKVFQEKF